MDEDNLYNIEYNTKRIDKEYYIDRTGRERKYKGDLNEEIVSFHYEIASTVFPDVKFPNSPDDLVLKKLGWILVGSSVYGHPIIHKKPTLRQLNKLKENDGRLYKYLSILEGEYYVRYTEWLEI